MFELLWDYKKRVNYPEFGELIKEHVLLSYP